MLIYRQSVLPAVLPTYRQHDVEIRTDPITLISIRFVYGPLQGRQKQKSFRCIFTLNSLPHLLFMSFLIYSRTTAEFSNIISASALQQ